MKQKLIIFVFLILLIGLLVGLNAATYVQKEKTPDNELMPNRSTFNNGSTGMQALYTLLSETGRKVKRWKEPPAALLIKGENAPAVFVVAGSVRRDFTDSETEQLLRWVSGGGRLVIIDRAPPEGLVTTTANWKISFDSPNQLELYSADPSDQKQMIRDVTAVHPVQPTVFTHSVNAVQPSRFASSIGFERFAEAGMSYKQGNATQLKSPPPPPASRSRATMQNENADDETMRELVQDQPRTTSKKIHNLPSPTPFELVPIAGDGVGPPDETAPVVHFASGERNLLVDAPFGNGKIVFLSDPYIVSNGGIGLVDNARLAINILSAHDGLIAFDEYHQGYGSNNNRFFQFFDGTPVVAIFLQAVVLLGLLFFSQSRRFARPLPEREPDRLSKLEYVSSMAELQQRTRAFDLAVENIYTDFRRRVARFLGVDNYATTRGEIAALIAERTKRRQSEIEDTLFKCEDIIRGEPTNKTEVLELAGKLHELEEKLGMKRSGKVKI